MKTDRFDEEFRRKLRGLPEESSPEEVNRIAGYVSRNLPPAPGLGWGGLAGYTIGGLVVLGSLLYNVVQYQKTTVLQTTVDSLKTAPPVLAQQPTPVVPPIVRTDTIYVTRYRNQQDAASIGLEQSTIHNEEQWVLALPGATRTRLDNPVLTNSNQPVRQVERVASNSRQSGHANDRRLPQSLLKIKPETILKPAQKEAMVTTEPATDSTGATATEPVVKNAEPIPSGSVWPETIVEPNVDNPLRNTVSTNKNVSNRRDVMLAKKRKPTKGSSPVNGALTREEMGNTTMNQRVADNTALHENRLTDSVQQRIDAEKEPVERSGVVVDLLKNRDIVPTKLSATIPRKPVYQPVAVSEVIPVRKPFRLHLPTVSLPNVQYFGGVAFSAGDKNSGGSLLGEVRLNRHWSVQAGVRALAQTGFDYHSSEDFEEHEGRDFRTLYAPNVTSGSEIQDIRQTYGLVQIPLAVAYHYPLGQAWGLRLGLGTNLDLLAHSRITFDFKRSGQEFEHGLHESNVPVSLFNNATVSAGVERQWKRLLLRASPYISPQFRRVSYKDDAFYWGGQVQLLWQFK